MNPPDYPWSCTHIKPALISNVNTVTAMSDHEAVLFQITMNPMKTTTPPHKVYNYKTANWESLKSNIILLTQKYFDRNPDNLDIDSNWNFFHQNFTKLIEQSIPSRMTKSKPHLPWITKNIIRMQRKRDKTRTMAKKTKKNTLGTLQKPKENSQERNNQILSQLHQ